jgi:hypothetical protein
MIDTDFGQSEHGISRKLERPHEADRENLIKDIHGRQVAVFNIPRES